MYGIIASADVIRRSLCNQAIPRIKLISKTGWDVLSSLTDCIKYRITGVRGIIKRDLVIRQHFESWHRYRRVVWCVYLQTKSKSWTNREVIFVQVFPKLLCLRVTCTDSGINFNVYRGLCCGLEISRHNFILNFLLNCRSNANVKQQACT